jgi:NAD(P)-dependent dehydrogenase (short-subunit alcohol dehydrogenase family)
MVHSNPFNARSTADHVLAGVDLTGRRFLVTGCNSGIGLETMNSLAANGAHVVGLAKSWSAASEACARVGPSCTAVACDLSDLNSVADAAGTIRAMSAPLDAVVANAGIAYLPELRTRYGVEMQFLVNHIGHFALINQLSELVRNGSGRIVLVSGATRVKPSPPEGIMFDNLDGRRFYRPATFYRQSKLAVALYAKELARRLQARGIAVNAVDPGATTGTQLDRHSRRPIVIRSIARLFGKNPQRAAATQALLAASPRVTGISGEMWADCRITVGPALLGDAGLAKRLWEVSERIVDAHTLPEKLLAAA